MARVQVIVFFFSNQFGILVLPETLITLEPAVWSHFVFVIFKTSPCLRKPDVQPA